MSSIRVHQDIYNFARVRSGFTARQWAGIAVAGIVALTVMALVRPRSVLAWAASGVAIGVVALPAVLAGFMPIWGMPAEEFAARLVAHARRGDALCWEGEAADEMKGKTTRDHKRNAKRKDAESYGHTADGGRERRIERKAPDEARPVAQDTGA